MTSPNILTDVLLHGLTIAGIGVDAGVVFGIVYARPRALHRVPSAD